MNTSKGSVNGSFRSGASYVQGEGEAAAAALRQAIDLIEAKRPGILPHELERFEADLAAMRAGLAEYEARRK